MKTYLLLLPVIFFSGCATPTYQLTDGRVNALAVADVLTAKCQSIFPKNAIYIEYRRAASKLLSVADLNTQLYNESYQKVTDITKTKTDIAMRADCNEYIPKIEAMIPEMNRDYDAYLYIISADKRQQAEAWAHAIELFAAAANQIGQAAQAYNYQLIPIPSGIVNVEPRKISSRGYNHYLVNTPGGTRQCHVSGSGFIFCN